MNTYMVIGLGRFGSAVAETLYNNGNEVIVLDSDEEHVSHLTGHSTHQAIGDAREPEVLRAAGAAECSTAIVAIGEDLASNVLITMNLKELGVPYVVSKARDDQYRKVLERVGADKVIIPERESGIRMANSLMSGSFMDYIELSEAYGIAEIRAPKAWAGKTLKDLNVRQRYKVSVLALKDEKSGEIVITPGASDVVKAGSNLMIMGESEALTRLQLL